MNKRIYNIIVAILMVCPILMASCSGDTEELTPAATLNVDVASGSELVTLSGNGSYIDVEFLADGGSVTLAVSTNQLSWEIEPQSNSHFTITKDGDNLTITAPKNELETSPSTQLFIKCGNEVSSASVCVNVKQKFIITGDNGAYLEISDTPIRFESPKEGNYKLPFETNQDVVTVSVTDNKFSAVVENGEIIIYSTWNKRTSPVTDALVVTAGDITVEIELWQQNEEMWIKIDPVDNTTFPVKPETRVYNITTNDDQWDRVVSADASRYFNIFSSFSSNTLTITPKQSNTSTEEFKGEVTLKVGDPSDPVELTLNLVQKGMEDGRPMKIELVVADGGTVVYAPTVGVSERNDGLDCIVDWGDGSDPETVTTKNPKHTYENPGTYIMTISGKVPTIMQYSNAKSRACFTKVLQWGNLGTTSLKQAFYLCKNLTEIPTDDNLCFAEVTNVYGVFESTGITEIPADLFGFTTKVTGAQYAFASTTIEKIPEGLFDTFTLCTNYGRTFTNCVNLKEVPANLFAKSPEVTTFINVFAGCSSLETISGDIFKNCPKVKEMAGVFSNCKSFNKIPEGLFKYNTEVESAGELFKNTAITSIPADLFNGFTKLVQFASVFSGCASLKEVPEGLLRYNTDVINFTSLFSDCTSLEQIPADLFKYNTKLTTLSYVFRGCSSLKSIPAGLFDNNKILNNLSNAFNGCTSLTGESPYTIVNGEKIHLYERNETNGFLIVMGRSSCFKGCTLLDDYDEIVAKGWH